MVEIALDRSAGHLDAARILLERGEHVREVLVRGVRRHGQDAVIADGCRYRGEIPVRVGKHFGNRAGDDGGRVHHQRSVVALAVGNEPADGLAAAAARHVLVGGLTQKAGLGQRLAGAAGGAVPAAAGAAGNQEMDLVDRLGRNRTGGAKGQGGQRRGRGLGQRSPIEFPVIHF